MSASGACAPPAYIGHALPGGKGRPAQSRPDRHGTGSMDRVSRRSDAAPRNVGFRGIAKRNFSFITILTQPYLSCMACMAAFHAAMLQSVLACLYCDATESSSLRGARIGIGPDRRGDVPTYSLAGPQEMRLKQASQEEFGRRGLGAAALRRGRHEAVAQDSGSGPADLPETGRKGTDHGQYPLRSDRRSELRQSWIHTHPPA
jgi:hypothetical protein